MDFHVEQAYFFKIIINCLHGARVNTAKLLTKTCLDKFDLDSPENYVPVHTLFTFFNDIKLQKNINNLFSK